MGIPAWRRLFVLAIVVAAAVASALAFAWMRRRSETLEERARSKATEMQERARELTK